MLKKSQILIVICIAASSLAVGSTIVKKSIPVSFNMDNKSMLSSFYITCNAELLSSSDFKHFKNDKPVERDLKAMFTKIKARKYGESAEFANKWKGKSFDQERADKLNRALKGYGYLIRKYEKSGKGIRAYDNLLIGNEGLIVFGCDGNSVADEPFTQRRAVFYEKTTADKTQWSVAEEYTPFQTLISESYQAQAEEPNLINTLPEKSQCTYKIPILGEGTENTVYLEFNGNKYNGVNVINDEIETQDEILSFYQYVNKLWLDFPPEDLAKYYTPVVRDWILGYKSEDVEKVRSAMRVGKRVFFIMEAKPFYVVFFKIGERDTLYSDFIYLDPNDNQLKITNPASMDFPRQYFGSDQFKQVLNTIDGKLFPLNSPN